MPSRICAAASPISRIRERELKVPRLPATPTGASRRISPACAAGPGAPAAPPAGVGAIALSTRYTRYPAAIVAAARSFKTHPLQIILRDQALRYAVRRIEFDVLARFAAEQLVERCLQRLALDVPQREIDRAQRMQSFLAW